MSLVSEALRKARQDAAEREGRGRGIPRGLALPPKRWSSGPGLVLAAVLVLAAALAGAGAAWWAFGHRPAKETARAEARAPGPATPVPAGAEKPFPTSPESSSPAVKPAGNAPTGPAGQAEKPDRAVVPASEADIRGAKALVPPTPAAVLAALPNVSELAAVPNVSEPAPGKRSKPPEPAESSRERSFVIDANLGHTKLHLDYIVYRPGSPFAGINGGQVFVGSVIEGFTVEDIAPESVRLRDTRGVVVLRVR